MTSTTANFTEDRAEIDSTPISCWTGYRYMNMTCADEDESLKANVKVGGLLSYASCTGSATCACTIAATVIGESGTYSVQGNQISFTSPSGTDSYSGFSYWVQDDLFHLTGAGTVVDSAGGQTIVTSSDIVAQEE